MLRARPPGSENVTGDFWCKVATDPCPQTRGRSLVTAVAVSVPGCTRCRKEGHRCHTSRMRPAELCPQQKSRAARTWFHVPRPCIQHGTPVPSAPEGRSGRTRSLALPGSLSWPSLCRSVLPAEGKTGSLSGLTGSETDLGCPLMFDCAGGRERCSEFLEARKIGARMWAVQPLGSWRSQMTIHLPSCW